MIKHHTKTLGDIGVLKAQVDLIQKGYIVAIPLTEHAPFDLIIYKDHKMSTVQVKARTVNSGKIEVSFKSSYNDSKGTKTVPVDKSKIDIYCVYCPDTDLCYYFNPDEFDKSVSIRLELPKNNQKKGIHLAKDFLNIPKL